MSNWLGKATAALTREPDGAPPSFAVTCECGQQHEGLRKSRSQRIICQTCGTPLFVLPRDAYPPPAPRKKNRRRSGPPKGPQLPPVADLVAVVLHSSTKAAVRVGSSVQRRGRAAQSSMIVTSKRLMSWFRSQLTPFRIVLTFVAATIAVTSMWSRHTWTLEQASRAYQAESEQAQQALEAGDLALAQTHFAQAADAADRLKLVDAQASELRQSARETTVLTRLSPESLYDMVLEAERLVTRQDVTAWEEAFRARYRDAWVILDATIARRSQTAGGGDTRVVFPVTVGQSDREIDILANLRAFDELANLDQPRQVIFAAQIQNCSLAPDRTKWVVELGPETGFLWGGLTTLKAAGFLPGDDELDEVLQTRLRAQAQRLEIP